jgi:hypothetical protein
MWDVVGIIAACVVILLMLQLLDVAEKLKVNFLGRKPSQDIEQRVADLEKRLEAFEKRG